MTARDLAPIKPFALSWIDRVIAGPQMTAMKPVTLAADDTMRDEVTDIAGNGLSGANNAITNARRIVWNDIPRMSQEDMIDAFMAETEAEDEHPAVNAHNDAVTADGVGDGPSVSAKSAKPVRRKPARKHKRARDPIPKVLAYLEANPSDKLLTVDELTDKLKFDKRMKVGRTSVGKALGIARS